MGAELHLPDLPEVAVSIGRAPPPPGVKRARAPLGWWLRDLFSTYLPLLLMALLAVGTGWLVRHTPAPPPPRSDEPLRQEPDYTMQDFAVVRFAPDGRVVVRMQGDRARHYPATDRFEIDEVRIQTTGDDGRVTDAVARRALANGDASEVQLIGGAQVRSRLAGEEPIEIDGEFLHAFLRFERVRSHLPVRVRTGSSEARAGGVDYDHLNQLLQLAGPVRATMAPAQLRRADRTPPGRGGAQ